MLNIVEAKVPDEKYVARCLERLQKCYPFITRETVGRSVLSRPIEALRIGGGREETLFAAAFHANEWLTALVLLRFAERLCAALDSGESIGGIDCRRALLGRGLTVVPCVNPDGVELSLHGFDAAKELSDEVRRIAGDHPIEYWSANARGVDLNRNYDAGWHISRQLELSQGINAPAPRRFGGERPVSEPETAAMVRLCEKRKFGSVYCFHSQGEEIYWKYGEHTPRRSQLIARVLAASSGYKATEPSGIASHAGFKDWFIERFRRPGFTIEIGKGKNPLPIEMFEEIYNRLEEMLMLAVVM